MVPIGPGERHANAAHQHTDVLRQKSERTARTLSLAYFGPFWPLATWCELRDDFRTFKLYRMQGFTAGRHALLRWKVEPSHDEVQATISGLSEPRRQGAEPAGSAGAGWSCGSPSQPVKADEFETHAAEPLGRPEAPDSAERAIEPASKLILGERPYDKLLKVLRSQAAT